MQNTYRITWTPDLSFQSLHIQFCFVNPWLKLVNAISSGTCNQTTKNTGNCFIWYLWCWNTNRLKGSHYRKHWNIRSFTKYPLSKARKVALNGRRDLTVRPANTEENYQENLAVIRLFIRMFII